MFERNRICNKMLETNGTCTCNKGLLSNCGQDCFYL